MFKGVLLDVDGVLVQAWDPLPGAVDAVARLRREDVPFRLVTNTTQLSCAGLAGKLREGGIDVLDEEVLTATAATAAYLRRHHPGAPCFLLAAGDALADLGDVNLVEDGAEVVVIGDAEEDFTYENLNRAFRMVMSGAALVAMQRGLYWMSDEGPALDVGAFVAGIEQAARVKAAVAGKPSPDFFFSALESLGLQPRDVLMVGDDVQSDVNAARDIGMHAVLVRTGKYRPEDEELIELPVRVIDSIADLGELI